MTVVVVAVRGPEGQHGNAACTVELRAGLARRDGVEVWHPDVAFYEISNAAGDQIGGFFVDLYARKHKRGGAWMDECAVRKKLGARLQLPVAYLVCNFPPPVRNSASLLNHDDVVTLFHEFGYTLHHLLTRVDIPSVAGINGVPWDAVELPSQFMENFAWQPEIIPAISGHYEDGRPLPEDTLQRLIDSRNFQAAMAMVRQLELALFDFRIHSAGRGLSAAEIRETLESEVPADLPRIYLQGDICRANLLTEIDGIVNCT